MFRRPASSTATSEPECKAHLFTGQGRMLGPAPSQQTDPKDEARKASIQKDQKGLETPMQTPTPSHHGHNVLSQASYGGELKMQKMKFNGQALKDLKELVSKAKPNQSPPDQPGERAQHNGNNYLSNAVYGDAKQEIEEITFG